METIMKRLVSSLSLLAMVLGGSAQAFAGNQVLIDQYGSFNGVAAVQGFR
jgi:hypothetical protein